MCMCLCARTAASAVSSATTKHSLGPASMSIATAPAICKVRHSLIGVCRQEDEVPSKYTHEGAAMNWLWIDIDWLWIDIVMEANTNERTYLSISGKTHQ